MSTAIDWNDRSRFVEAMSRAAWTVNVVTTDGPGGRAGVTVSAMTSVSADTPKPSLLVCIHDQSRAAGAILDNQNFCVNVLKDDQAHIADMFAGRLVTKADDKFACGTWTVHATGAPRLVDPLVAFDCRLISQQRIGTHYVFMGAVDDIAIATDSLPLVHSRRDYVKIRDVKEDNPFIQPRTKIPSAK